MPGPESVTRIRTASTPCSTRTRTSLPPYFTALSTRFTSTCWIRPASPAAWSTPSPTSRPTPPPPGHPAPPAPPAQRQLRPHRLDGRARELGDVDLVVIELDLTPVEAAGEQELVDDLRQ